MDQPEQKATSQNRLLILSAAIFFYYYAEAKVDGFSLLGTTVRFGNEGALVEFGWMIWTYYYLRTYQYYKAVGRSAYVEAWQAQLIAAFEKRMPPHQKNDLRLFRERETQRPLVIRLILASPSTATALPNHAPRWHQRIRRTPLSLLLRLLRGHRTQTGGPMRINFLRRRRISRLRRWLLLPRLNVIPQILIFPASNLEFKDGGERISLSLGLTRAFMILLEALKSILFRPAFWENYGPLILGLLPVWYITYLHKDELLATAAAFFRV